MNFFRLKEPQALQKVVIAILEAEDFALRVNTIARHTKNTWQSDRGKAEISRNTFQGKLAEKVAETYLKKVRHLQYLSYDAFRNDAGKKHAPFDGMLYDSGSDLQGCIHLVLGEVQLSSHGSISPEARETIRQLGCRTVEIKSTKIDQKRKQRADFQTYACSQDIIRLIEVILREDFLTYPHYCRSGEISNLQDYCQFVREREQSFAGLSGKALLDAVIANVKRYQCDLFIRLYTDEAQKRAFILGYLTRDAFFDCDIQVKKMIQPNKSEKAVYFAKNLSFADAIDNLK